MWTLLPDYLIPNTTSGEDKVFYSKMKGDYHRYIAKYATGGTHMKSADAGIDAYKSGTGVAVVEPEPVRPIRLGLALNFSVFCYGILNSPEHACHLANHSLDDAMAEVDNLDVEILQRIYLYHATVKDQLDSLDKKKKTASLT